MYDEPLISAAYSNSIKVMRQLLAHPNIDVYVRNCFGNTALHWAVKRGHYEAVEVLLTASDIDVNVKNENGCSALSIAAGLGAVGGIVCLLLSSPDINVESKNVFGNTALHIASIKGRMRAAHALLDAGADINARNCYGETPLHMACKGLQDDVVQLLLECVGIDVNARDYKNRTPYMRALDQDFCSPVLRRLLEDDRVDADFADLERVSQEEYGYLFLCFWNAYRRPVDSVHARAYIDGPELSYVGVSLFLFGAAKRGDVRSMRYVLQRYNVMHSLSFRRPIHVCSLPDDDGMSILHWTALLGHVDAVQFIVNTVPSDVLDIDQTDCDGLTALQYAVRNGHSDVVDIIRSASYAMIDDSNMEGAVPMM